MIVLALVFFPSCFTSDIPHRHNLGRLVQIKGIFYGSPSFGSSVELDGFEASEELVDSVDLVVSVG